MKNYEQKYKEMKKRVLAIGQGYVKEVDYNSPRSIAEYIDPELCESEDEKIIRTLKEIVNWGCAKNISVENNVELKDCLAWLEKQGGKVDVLDDFPTEFERQISHLIASSINKEWEYKKDFVKHTANALLQYAKNELEKQGEQKTEIKYVYPKFRIEDVIVEIKPNGNCPPVRVKYIGEGSYSCISDNRKRFLSIPIRCEDEYKLVEQKPTQEIKPFEAEHGKYYYCIKDYFCGGKKQASKGDVVQALRGLPIMGLKDASEYFLPVNNIQKPTWSEEDENMRQDIISGLKAQIQSIYAYDEQGKAQMNNRIDWLKSIKINHWKPSEEQMKGM